MENYSWKAVDRVLCRAIALRAISTIIALNLATPSAESAPALDPSLSNPVTSVAELEASTHSHPAPSNLPHSTAASSTEIMAAVAATEVATEVASTDATVPNLVAGADNFNPGLQLPPPPPDPLPPKPELNPNTKPLIVLESLQPDFRRDRNKFGQVNQIAETEALFRLRNGDHLRFRSGSNLFKQQGIETISNIPIKFSGETRSGNVKLRGSIGADFFNRLPAVPILGANIEMPLTPGITLVGVAEYGAYKFNAKTLENQITALRLGTNLFWKINKKTSLFSLYRHGKYSDDNTEHQSFSRLEHKLGQFAIATNLFTWSYKQDVATARGYFSPPDFLVYNGELSWEGNPFEFLRCRVSGQLGRQRLTGKFSNAGGYQMLCTVKFSPKVEADLGYGFSNVKQSGTSEDAANNRTLIGQLRLNF